MYGAGHCGMETRVSYEPDLKSSLGILYIIYQTDKGITYNSGVPFQIYPRIPSLKQYEWKE